MTRYTVKTIATINRSYTVEAESKESALRLYYFAHPTDEEEIIEEVSSCFEQS